MNSCSGSPKTIKRKNVTSDTSRWFPSTVSINGSLRRARWGARVRCWWEVLEMTDRRLGLSLATLCGLMLPSWSAESPDLQVNAISASGTVQAPRLR